MDHMARKSNTKIEKLNTTMSICFATCKYYRIPFYFVTPTFFYHNIASCDVLKGKIRTTKLASWSLVHHS